MKNLFFIILFLFLAGCENPEAEMKLSPAPTAEKPITVDFTLENGQHVKYVEYRAIGDWLKENKKITLVSICPVDRAGHGLTCGFIIVYSN